MNIKATFELLKFSVLELQAILRESTVWLNDLFLQIFDRK